MSREQTSTPPHERTGLIVKQVEKQEGRKSATEERRGLASHSLFRILVVGLVVVVLVLYFAASSLPMLQQQQYQQRETLFPNNFVWGVATSSYQIEGAVQEEGRGKSIWDVFVHSPSDHNILDNSTADIACDHYHRVQQDVALIKSCSVRAYRFSISWPRIFPNGTGIINPQGVQFYNNLINHLISNDIEPWVTMYHWDLPQALQDKYGGWMDPQIVVDFGEYARVLYQNYGDRVKRWITINEPWTVSVNGYSTGVHAPGRNQYPATEPYIVAHHMLLAHARAYHIYQQEFMNKQQGTVGIANSGDYRYPFDINNPDDLEAAERAMLFQFGWFVEPLVKGEYPRVMRQRLKERLPHFSATEQEQLIGSFDFLGLNYYSALLASKPTSEATWGGYWADIFVDFQSDPRWKQNDMGWNVVPEGLHKMLLWISQRYDFPLLFITENGTAEKEGNDRTPELDDTERLLFLENHLNACVGAIQDGVNLAGYFAWSLMDNFEWQFGYQRRFGLYRVDFETLERKPKSSALWYRDIISSNGAALRYTTVRSNEQRRRSLRQRVPLPSKVLMGYASDCDAARNAVEQGVNIISWAFVDIRSSAEGNQPQTQSLDSSNHFGKGKVVTTLNLTRIERFMEELDATGYASVVHLASFGGWNGDHLDDDLSAEEWYDTFKDSLGDLFDGIDWDLEGNDDLSSPLNLFSTNCLEKMGEISKMASVDGFYVTAAPPQSYLDIHGTSHFSRYVNLTDSSRHWHAEFHYFGRNVYAYLLAMYGQYIDLVSIQFYESYSRANQAITEDHIAPSKYLQDYVKALATNEEQFFIEFTEDEEVHLPSQHVALPLSKLVFGFRNGWADTNEKAIFFDPRDIRDAWLQLKLLGIQPRGFMFWTIDEEGRNGIFLARDLGKLLIVDE